MKSNQVWYDVSVSEHWSSSTFQNAFIEASGWSRDFETSRSGRYVDRCNFCVRFGLAGVLTASDFLHSFISADSLQCNNGRTFAIIILKAKCLCWALPRNADEKFIVFKWAVDLLRPEWCVFASNSLVRNDFSSSNYPIDFSRSSSSANRFPVITFSVFLILFLTPSPCESQFCTFAVQQVC